MADIKYLGEAFQALNILDEDIFDVSDEGIKDFKDLVNSDEEIVEPVIDPLAQSEEDLKDSYIGKAILDCTICQSKIYKDPTEVIISETEDLANIGEICPYCQSSDGYKIIGQVTKYKPEEEIKVEVDGEELEDLNESKKSVEVLSILNNLRDDHFESLMDLEWEDERLEDEETWDRVEELFDEAENEPIAIINSIKKEFPEVAKHLSRNLKIKNLSNESLRSKKLAEEFDKVEIETNGQKIKVETEPVEEKTENEMIGELTTEIEDEFKIEEPEYQDIEIDEFEESDFDELGEKYLRRVYENVASYRTINGSTKGNQLKLEGIITFKSGKQAKTNFVFEAKTVTKTGKLKFIGENKQFAKGSKSFTLTGRTNGSKLIAESLTYNYRGKDDKTGKSKKLYGTVSKINK